MQILLEVILPVFVVIGAGYLTVWRGYFTGALVEALMRFATHFAIPCLLFLNVANLDLAAGFDWRLLISFYLAALICFVLGLLSARWIFGRDWQDAVVVGFICLFSNSILLGLPITERAFGTDALVGNFMIIALHAPFCYGVGITVMEIIRARGGTSAVLVPKVLKAMFSNAIILGITLGIVVNVTQLPIPEVIHDGLTLISRAALPVALFGLGGVLYQYRPEGDMRLILWACAISLCLHPGLVYGLGGALNLDQAGLRSALMTASVAPGINAYLFADMYGRAKRVAASTVLFATAGCILTVWVWLGVL